MYNVDLETFYSKIKRSIAIVSSYMEEDIYTSIIKTCRLKPHSVFSKKFKFNTQFENWWCDEFGNSLRFENKKSIIVLSDAALTENTKIKTDLFFGATIASTISKSKLIFVAENNSACIIALYGKDEYFRTYMFDGEWQKISPLVLGTSAIQEILNNQNNRYQKEINITDFANNFVANRCVIIALPIKHDMISWFRCNALKEVLCKGNNG